jgi:N-acetylglucosamine-6-sulfatase
MLRSRYRLTLVVGLCAALAAGLLLVWPGWANQDRARAGSATGSAGAATAAEQQSGGKKPNILYVLTDDLSWNLVKYMPHVREMAKEGTTFSNFFATDSLCCPSRTTIMTGQFPHNTGVFTNSGNDGGYRAFLKNHNERKCYGRAMQKAGYQTGFMGKYLNGYQPADKHGTPKPYVPSGWDEWDVAGDAYSEYNYDLNENGRVKHYGHKPKDYLTDVMSRKATSFVNSSAKSKKPFMLELSTFAPHGPSTPAPRDAHKYPNLKAPRTDAYNKATKPTPKWQKELKPLSAKEKKRMDRSFAKRVRSVQAVDAMIGHLKKQLKAKGMADDTYIVFGSDNGFHMGEHRLRQGKQTAYDTDTKLPLMVTGPGVKAGKKVPQLAQNTDLSPTFQELAGIKRPANVDGESLVDLMHGRSPDDWRESVLVEHRHPKTKKNDPDAAPDSSGNPPSYEAIRTAHGLYVEYADGEREYYATKSDPEQLKNRVKSLPADKRKALHDAIGELKHCKGTKSCRDASKVHE